MIYLVKTADYIKKLLRCKTWQLESIFVLVVLVGVALISQKGVVEWIGVGAVWLTFMHASVANRLEEAERVRANTTDARLVHCYQWISRYFYMKEVLWFLYFFLLGAWSALAGSILFLLYGPWRHLWRRHNPKQ